MTADVLYILGHLSMLVSVHSSNSFQPCSSCRASRMTRRPPAPLLSTFVVYKTIHLLLLLLSLYSLGAAAGLHVQTGTLICVLGTVPRASE